VRQVARSAASSRHRARLGSVDELFFEELDWVIVQSVHSTDAADSDMPFVSTPVSSAAQGLVQQRRPLSRALRADTGVRAQLMS
jgi:hypothetical protein